MFLTYLNRAENKGKPVVKRHLLRTTTLALHLVPGCVIPLPACSLYSYHRLQEGT